MPDSTSDVYGAKAVGRSGSRFLGAGQTESTALWTAGSLPSARRVNPGLHGEGNSTGPRSAPAVPLPECPPVGVLPRRTPQP